MKNNQIKIDISNIPQIELKLLCKTLCEAIIKSTEDKAFIERFEHWQKNRSEEVKEENE